MNTNISTTINGYPIDITVVFTYSHSWLYIYVWELEKYFITKRPKSTDVDLYDYAIDVLTEEIENALHKWLIHNADDVHYHSEGVSVLVNGKEYAECKTNEAAQEIALLLNKNYYD